MQYLRKPNYYRHMDFIYRADNGYKLYVGDCYAARDVGLLKRKKVTSVLTVADGLHVCYPPILDITHRVIRAKDVPTYRISEHFGESCEFIRRGLQKGNVLVHCAAGVSRSVACVLAYLMQENKYSPEQALTLVRSRRVVANPNYGFRQQLVQFHRALQIQEQKSNKLSQTGNKIKWKTFEQNPLIQNYSIFGSQTKSPLTTQQQRLKTVNYSFTLTNIILSSDQLTKINNR